MGVDRIQATATAQLMTDFEDQEPAYDRRYMVTVTTDRMEPRYAVGEQLIINRDAPVKPDDFVLIVLEPGNTAVIGRLLAANEQGVSYRLLNPSENVGVLRNRIKHIHRIDGCYTPM